MICKPHQHHHMLVLNMQPIIKKPKPNMLLNLMPMNFQPKMLVLNFKLVKSLTTVNFIQSPAN